MRSTPAQSAPVRRRVLGPHRTSGATATASRRARAGRHRRDHVHEHVAEVVLALSSPGRASTLSPNWATRAGLISSLERQSAIGSWMKARSLVGLRGLGGEPERRSADRAHRLVLDVGQGGLGAIRRRGLRGTAAEPARRSCERRRPHHAGSRRSGGTRSAQELFAHRTAREGGHAAPRSITKVSGKPRCRRARAGRRAVAEHRVGEARTRDEVAGAASRQASTPSTVRGPLQRRRASAGGWATVAAGLAPEAQKFRTPT